MTFNEALAQRVRVSLSQIPDLVEKKMFGGIGFLISGNMACGVHGEDLIVRLDAPQAEAALTYPYVRPFDMTGRPMKGWLFVSSAGLQDDASLNDWISQAVAFAGSLPPKT